MVDACAGAGGKLLMVCVSVCVAMYVYTCDDCADLGSLSSLVKLRSLNVSNQGYTQQQDEYPYDQYYYVHVLTGEWRMQSVVW